MPRAVGFEPLSRDLKTTLIKPINRARVKASEGNVMRVEVSRMDSVSFHPRETSTPTPGTTHQPQLHPQLRKAGLDKALSQDQAEFENLFDMFQTLG